MSIARRLESAAITLKVPVAKSVLLCVGGGGGSEDDAVNIDPDPDPEFTLGETLMCLYICRRC
jgi:hypothetical protein